MERNIEQKIETRQLTKGEQMFKDLDFVEDRHLVDPVPPGYFVPQDSPKISFTKIENKPAFNGWKEELTTYINFDIWSKKVSVTEISRKTGEGKTHTSYFSGSIDTKLLAAINQMVSDLKWR